MSEKIYLIGERGKELIEITSRIDSGPAFFCDTFWVDPEIIDLVVKDRCEYCGVKSNEFDVCPHCGAPK